LTGFIPWIVIVLVAGFLVWRMVTSRSRAERRMFERMNRTELEGLDVEKLKEQGLEKIYREVMEKKQREWH
jgi:hypothetical protein